MTTRIAAMTFAALLLSLAAAETAWAQSVGDPVPLLNGTEKAKVLYSIPYVRSNANVATCVSCTSTEKSNIILADRVAFEVYTDGALENDLTMGEGVADVDYGGDTEMLCTRQPASVHASAVLMGAAAESVIYGAGRVVATTNKLICTAFLVSVVGDPPSFMTILPLYKGTKQKGGM